MEQGTSLTDLKTLLEQVADQKEIYDEMKAKAEAESKKFTALKAELDRILEAHDMEKANLPGRYNFSRTVGWSFKTPKNPEDKVALFNHLKEIGGEDFLLANQSINSATLNKLGKAEHEKAVERGDIDWAGMPGCAMSAYTRINITKARS